MEFEVVSEGSPRAAGASMGVGALERGMSPEGLLAQARTPCQHAQLSGGGRAVMAAKEAVNRAYELSLEAGLEFERRSFFLLFSSEDQKEGMRAFIEKRPAEWKGR